jgi:hypothetical protein
MKCTVELTEAEKKTLQELLRKHPHQDFRNRGLGLLELASAGGLMRSLPSTR